MDDDVTARPFPNFRFEVDLVVDDAAEHGLTTPLCSAVFSECTGLEASMTPKTLQEGGNNLEQVHLVGPVTYGQLTLKRGMTDSMDLWIWFSVVAGRVAPDGARADGEVRVLRADGEPGLTFKIDRCLPVKLKAPALAGQGGGLAIEELAISYTRFRVARG